MNRNDMKRIVYFLVSLLGFTKLAAQDPADFVLPSIISDHAVMQRDAEVKLWGWCPSVWDLKIVCSWAPNDTVHVSSDKYKYWETYINTPKAEGPHAIRFYGWEGKLCAEVKDILMGETWLCSGQSNMEYCFKWRVDDITDRSTLFDNKKIRFFKVAKSSSAYPVERIQGKWEICSPETAEDFSVVAFCFGKRLNEELGNLPIGLIGSYWGGTAIEPWMDEFTLRHEKLEEKTKALTAGWAPTANSSLYNAMIHPIINYTIAGVVWYQGEANNERHQDYGVMFDAMIRDFDERYFKYGDEVMTYSPDEQHNPYIDENGNEYFEYSQTENQFKFFKDDNGEYIYTSDSNYIKNMVVAGDLVNDLTDIHPSLKRQVGERLANMALKNSYHKEDIQPYSPMLKSFRVDGRKVIVTTTAIGKLACKDKVIRHFEVLDKEGNLHPAKASILKNGDISVIADKVKEPVGVRYCFSNDAMPNLFDSNGLPLAPFRTDRKK